LDSGSAGTHTFLNCRLTENQPGQVSLASRFTLIDNHGRWFNGTLEDGIGWIKIHYSSGYLAGNTPHSG